LELLLLARRGDQKLLHVTLQKLKQDLIPGLLGEAYTKVQAVGVVAEGLLPVP